MADTPSPWLTLAEASAYAKRGRRFLLAEIKAGRLRAARVGGRGLVLTRAEWLDAWIEAQATPVPVVQTCALRWGGGRG
jgi:excisionase family DNA binding protein